MDRKNTLAYLGAPYNHPDLKVKALRLHAVTQMAFDLTKQGHIVYSPLTHNAPIDRLGIFGNWEVWQTHNHCMLSRSDKLLVYKLPGWEDSKGLNDEIKLAKLLSIPIEEIEPKGPLHILQTSYSTFLKKLSEEIQFLATGEVTFVAE